MVRTATGGCILRPQACLGQPQPGPAAWRVRVGRRLEREVGEVQHPIKRRFWAEDLVRLRRAREQRRYAAPQRRARIDPNPHQIDAVIFALERIPSGGCILADEVGLGKTIEAGLIMAQLLAEGARRVLLVMPKSLLGQWTDELYTLFNIEVAEFSRESPSLKGDGVFICSRGWAGGERGAELLRNAERFDLCVIDEAHEFFGGIHRRYDQHGNYQEDAQAARTAHRVREAMRHTPKLMLTATPIQNSLSEIWGLVQYVEPTGTLLGDLPTFREVFCAGDDRTIVPQQADELRLRLATVVQRTLRRQAQEFLERPFVERRAILHEYTMSPDERALYDDVTRYLLDPTTCAFPGAYRHLVLVGFHRRMASSRRALAASLRRLAERLENLRASSTVRGDGELLEEFASDLEDELDVEEFAATSDPIRSAEEVGAELARIRGFISLPAAGPHDRRAGRLPVSETRCWG